MENKTQIANELLKAIADVIVECVRTAGPLGMPGGHLYAVLMTQGCTLEQFEQIMAGMCAAGKLTKKGQLYFVVEAK